MGTVSGGYQFIHNPFQLIVIAGPFVGLHLSNTFRFNTDHFFGQFDVQVADIEADQIWNIGKMRAHGSDFQKKASQHV